MEQSHKRSNIRYLIDLEVNAIATGQSPFACRVRDYCLGGMFLNKTPQGAETSALQLAKGQLITIEFLGRGNKLQKIPARIVNVNPAGLGVKFENVSDEALNALLAIATQQQEEQEQGPALAGAWQSEGRTGLQLLLKDTLQRHLISLFSSFHEAVVDAIFERASRPRNVNEQNQMFEALDLLNKRRHDSFLKVNQEISSNFDDFADGRPLHAHFGATAKATSGTATLSLVDDKEFEDWLWASTTVAHLESLHEEELYALNRRLTQIHGRPIGNDNNPLAAPLLCHTFQELFRSFEIADAAREILISTFQEIIEQKFSALITEANHHLISRGILPEVKRDMHIRRLGAEIGQQVVKPVRLDQSAPPASPVSTPQHTAPLAPPTHIHQKGDFGGSNEIGHGPASGLAQVRTMLRTSRSGNAAGHVPAGSAASHGRIYSSNELSSALNHIESEISTIRANRSKGESILDKLKESLARMGGDSDRAIPAAQQESIEVIDNLMESVGSDPILADESRGWLEQLEMPLLKTAIKDETLIENRDHPATVMLNRLDVIGKSLSPKGGQRTEVVRNQIDQLLAQVKQNADSDDPGFDQALSRLEDLYTSMRHQYESSVTELTRRCNDEYTISAKRDELLALLDQHFGGQMLPVIIFEIMDAGWKNLLLRSYVREGAEGRIFRRFLEVIDQIIARLTGNFQQVGGTPWPEQTLLELVPRGLRQVPVSEEPIERLMSKLTPQFAMAAVEPSAISLKLMPKITELAEEKRKRQLQERIAQLQVPAERWEKASDSVESMVIGDMVAIPDDTGKMESHKLVWLAPNQSRYVFVDGEGHISRDLSREELTALLLRNQASILEGWDVPLMDRATYSMLLSIHNKLLQQTNYDPLTNLYNQRAFGLELDKLLERSRIEKAKNLLCYFDIDHFALINSMCGHSEGDRLLQETADLLQKQMPKNSFIGRITADKFALLLPDLSRTEGLMVIRKLQQALHTYKFLCKGESYRVTASFGLVEMGELSESGAELMAAAENACRVAKENGRDRLEIHHDATSTQSRRERLFKLINSLDEAIEQNQLQLVCQRILPINEGNVNQAPYYEILLRLQDEQGNPVSHADFIHAAEMFNRSIDVDLWVSRTVIDWLEQRFAAGKTLPIASINLSGRSVNNKGFMDNIASRIIKSTIPRNHLCFEITETAAIGDMGQATHFINRIKRLGCSFSLDDFGTGLSSYSYLKALPVDYIKIDGSFVRNCQSAPRDLAVIKSVTEIGHAMGKKTIAEFVENEHTLKLLHELGVDYAQGYGIEKPIPLSQLN